MPTSSLLSFDTDLAWFEAIATRASRRRYDGEPVRPEALQSIEDACRRASALPGEGVRAVAVNAPPDGVFTGSSATTALRSPVGAVRRPRLSLIASAPG